MILQFHWAAFNSHQGPGWEGNRVLQPTKFKGPRQLDLMAPLYDYGSYQSWHQLTCIVIIEYHIYIYVHRYIDIWIWICICMYVCMYVRTYVCMYVCTNVCTYRPYIVPVQYRPQGVQTTVHEWKEGSCSSSSTCHPFQPCHHHRYSYGHAHVSSRIIDLIAILMLEKDTGQMVFFQIFKILPSFCACSCFFSATCCSPHLWLPATWKSSCHQPLFSNWPRPCILRRPLLSHMQSHSNSMQPTLVTSRRGRGRTQRWGSRLHLFGYLGVVELITTFTRSQWF